MRLKYDPHTLIIDQTVLCNQACAFCWRADREAVKAATAAAPSKIMPLDMFKRIIDAHQPIESLRRLSLCGPMGEPTLVPDLAERGAYAMASGRFPSYVLINTNGYALDRHDPPALLQAFTRISVSLDAVFPEIHARIHGRAHQLDRIQANLDALVQAKLALRGHAADIEVRFTEGAENMGHFPAFERVFAGRVDRIVHKREHAFVDVLPHLASRAGALLCNQPRGNINWTVDGRLTTCCVNHRQEPSFGHIDDGRTVKEMWESPDFEAWRVERHAGICATCSGLGSQSQRPGGGLSAREQQKLRQIEAVGEKAFFE